MSDEEVAVSLTEKMEMVRYTTCAVCKTGQPVPEMVDWPPASQGNTA
jgi:hypothetical protein